LSPLKFKTRNGSHFVPTTRFDAPKLNYQVNSDSIGNDFWRYSPNMTIEDWKSNTLSPDKHNRSINKPLDCLGNTMTSSVTPAGGELAVFSQTAPNGFSRNINAAAEVSNKYNTIGSRK